MMIFLVIEIELMTEIFFDNILLSSIIGSIKDKGERNGAPNWDNYLSSP